MTLWRKKRICIVQGNNSFLGAEIIHALSQNGTVLLYGLQSGQTSAISNAEVLFKEITIKGFWLAKWLPMKSVPERAALFKHVLELIMQDQLIPPVEKTYSLSDFALAFKDQCANEKGRVGKILFDFSLGVDY